MLGLYFVVQQGKVRLLRTPGNFGHTFANSGNPDVMSRLIRIFTVCLRKLFFIPIIKIRNKVAVRIYLMSEVT